MKSPLASILIGAATLTAAMYLLNKYFRESAAQNAKPAADLVMTDADCPDLPEDPCLFPNAMLVETPGNEVDNWGRISERVFISNHNFNSIPDDL